MWAPVLGGGLGVDPGGGLEWCSAAAFRGVRAAHWPHEEMFQLHFHIHFLFLLILFILLLFLIFLLLMSVVLFITIVIMIFMFYFSNLNFSTKKYYFSSGIFLAIRDGSESFISGEFFIIR